MSTSDTAGTLNGLYRGSALPVGAIGTSASGWWGTWFLLISEAALFAYLFFSYFYFSVQPSANWVPGGRPSFLYPAIQTILVLAGCGAMWFAHRSMLANERLLAFVGTGGTWLLCSAFIAVQLLDWADKPFSFALDTYSAEYYLITGVHLAHVSVGWVMLLMVAIWTLLGYFDPVRCLPITITKLYWYFVAATWIGVFFTLTCTPYFF
jgi:heme/copper-type cytochrome/quinol oxidase subunit 3